MSRMKVGPRAQAAVVLTLVALTGALLGIVGDRLVAQQRDTTPQFDTPAQPAGPGMGPGMMPGMMGPGMRYGERLALRLDLTEQQRIRIDSILAQEQLRVRELSREFQPRFRAIAEQTRDRVEQVLTPEQRERLGALRAERMRRLGPDRPMFRDGARQGGGQRPRP